jgi:hypothetical protein
MEVKISEGCVDEPEGDRNGKELVVGLSRRV